MALATSSTVAPSGRRSIAMISSCFDGRLASDCGSGSGKADNDVSRREDGRFYPQDPRGKYDVAQWVGWQLANQGPKLGEQDRFRRAAESGNNGDLTYALRRFDNEAHRIFGVMNLGLFNKRYLAAGEYTIADMICYPWGSSWATRKIDIEEFPNVKRWLEEIGERAAVKKAMAMGPEFRVDPASISSEEQARRRKLVADQRAQPIPSEWVRAA